MTHRTSSPRASLGLLTGERRLRAALFEMAGEELASADAPRESPEGDPEFEVLAALVREVRERAGLRAESVIGIGLAAAGAEAKTGAKTGDRLVRRLVGGQAGGQGGRRGGSPGQRAGGLEPSMAKRLALAAGTPVSELTTRCRARVPGCGIAEPSTMLLAADPPALAMNSRRAATVPGLEGPIAGGILPGYAAYEVNGAAAPRFDRELEGGAGPRGAAAPEILALAFDLRRRVEAIEAAGVPVRRFVACGALARECRPLLQRVADVMGERVTLHTGRHRAACGAAILGVLAAGRPRSGFPAASSAIKAMGRVKADLTVLRPDRAAGPELAEAYARYARTGG